MEDKDDYSAVLSQPRSDSKVGREKRRIDELRNDQQLDARKRANVRDLNGIDGHTSKLSEGKEDMTQVVEVLSQSSQSGKNEKTSLATVNRAAPRELGLGGKMCNANNLPSNNDIELGDNFKKPNAPVEKGFGLDLNLKSRDVSECGSTITGPTDKKDPLKVWKEMKQNGFVSSFHGGIAVQRGNISSSNGGVPIQSGNVSCSHGGIPVPKQRGRKRKEDVIKKRMELARKEQVDRFTKIAAPSGLLNELNPGIINHVRNRKQVHSIIKALVRSEKHDNDNSGCSKDFNDQNDPSNDSTTQSDSLSQEGGSEYSLSGNVHAIGMSMSMPMNLCFTSVSDEKSGDNASNIGGDDMLAQKLSSYLEQASENHPSSNHDTCLTVKAATVASQWLELIYLDVKGRLSALRRSKKRVRAVITTELPFLIAKEFSSNQENDPYNIQRYPADGHSNNTMAEMHRARWSSLFDQMDKSLSEEERQLESWLNQVKEMQLHCERGLQVINWNSAGGSLKHGTSENDISGMAECADRELALKAAAASIYSTCSFLLSKENISCC
ncbi:hypothetical protein ACFE04_018448 [Oxalis oulophora]